MRTSTKKITKTDVLLHCVIISLVIISGNNCFAQDTIITRNGQSIIGHIIEISTTEVKYKKMEVTDGPLYIEDKSGVDRIKYKNGFTDVFPELKPWQLPVTKIERKEEATVLKQRPALVKRGGLYMYNDVKLSENQLYKILLSVNDPSINYQVRIAKRSKAFQYAGFAAAPFATLSLLAAIAATRVHSDGTDNTSQTNASKAFFGCAVICAVSPIYFKINRKHRNAEAVRLYKQKFD